MLIPGIVSATLKEKSAEDVIALCLKAGLEAIEWSENIAGALPEGTIYVRITASGDESRTILIGSEPGGEKEGKES